MKSKTDLLYLVKIEGTFNNQLLHISKQIWKNLLANQIMITVEYLPSKLNVKVHWELHHTDSSPE